jgi:hypothetical protein
MYGGFCAGLSIVLVGTPYVIYKLVSALKVMRVFEEASTTTTAQVHSRHMHKHESTDYAGWSHVWTTHYIDVAFSVQAGIGAEQMILEAHVDEQLYNKAKQGTTLAIRYANANPCIALLGEEIGTYSK